MEKNEVIQQITGYLFLAIDHKEERVIVCMENVEHGYNGFSLGQDNRGYTLSPLYIASSFIKSTERRYDFTHDLQEAFDGLFLWNHSE